VVEFSLPALPTPPQAVNKANAADIRTAQTAGLTFDKTLLFVRVFFISAAAFFAFSVIITCLHVYAGIIA
jgi:hypothetical protein